MRDNKHYQAYAQKMKAQGQSYSQAGYEDMRKAYRKERTIREDQDPEFKEAFKKLNIERLFAEFTARPKRSTVNEMAEEFMQMDVEKKMSRRDKARKKFIHNFKMKQARQTGMKNMIIAEREKFLDFEEQVQYQSDKPLKDLEYQELVEVLDRDVKLLDQMSG